ncbi:MAG: hypothetical protein IJ801_06355, partial [Lachnospiraceae bacterium]|nr:hypothetical protein [Lachnospiraceae bacterium]
MGNAISYTTSGKRFRGFLCMVTFCAFMAGLILSGVGIRTYGTSLLETDNYFDSDVYQQDISAELTELLNDVIWAYGTGENEWSVADGFSITDVEAGKIYYYDMMELWRNREELEIGDSLSGLEPYKTAEKTLAYDLADYSQMAAYLNSDLARNNYIYFSTEAFKDLFRQTGHVNTEYCYSTYFSKQAYFVFDASEYPDAEYGDAEGEETVVYEIGWDDDSEEYTKTAVSVNKEGVENSYVYDIAASLDYAVYDPQQNIFYSTNDDYFSDMENYIYRAESLEDVLPDTEYAPDNIVLALLRSYNMSVNEVATDAVNRGEESAWAMTRLDARQDGGMLLYDIRNTRFHSSNEESVDDIQNLPYAYEQGEDSEKEGIEKADALVYYDEDLIGTLEGTSVFYFGIDPDRAETEMNQEDKMSWKYRYYRFFAKGIGFMLAGTVIALLLLIAQAVWLIRTTGRRAKDDREIALNRFDRLPTELWAVCYVGILVSCVMLPRIYIGFERLSRIVIWGILITLPFGFFFMILTLSLARRIKAHNLWSRLYGKTLLQHIRKRAGEFCSRRK